MSVLFSFIFPENFSWMCYSKLSLNMATILSNRLIFTSHKKTTAIFITAPLHAMCLFNFSGLKSFSLFSPPDYDVVFFFCLSCLRCIGLLVISCYYIKFRDFSSVILSSIFLFSSLPTFETLAADIWCCLSKGCHSGLRIVLLLSSLLKYLKIFTAAIL